MSALSAATDLAELMHRNTEHVVTLLKEQENGLRLFLATYGAEAGHGGGGGGYLGGSSSSSTSGSGEKVKVFKSSKKVKETNIDADGNPIKKERRPRRAWTPELLELLKAGVKKYEKDLAAFSSILEDDEFRTLKEMEFTSNDLLQKYSRLVVLGDVSAREFTFPNVTLTCASDECGEEFDPNTRWIAHSITRFQAKCLKCGQSTDKHRTEMGAVGNQDDLEAIVLQL